MISGAIFSECRTYRYRLWRIWDSDKDEENFVNFVMLNPSTADEVKNDPTVERCERRARAMGYGGLVVTNIFALRSTDPNWLYEHPDPVGTINDEHLISAAQEAALVVCGWGAHGAINGRGQFVMRMLKEAGATPHALKITKGGEPGHPLYIGYGVAPRPVEAI